MNTPRIRTDLHATPAEEQGIKYFDVSDPRSGARMRMYDFEWLIASRMDGARPFDEVAAWARERLGIQPSANDLEDYAKKLRELGFFELEADAPVRAAPTAATMMSMPAPVLSANNGAGKSSTDELAALEIDAAEEEKPMPALVTEASLMGSGPSSPPPTPHDEPATAAPAVAADGPRITRNTTPAATAPTTAMQAVTAADEERAAIPPPQARMSEPPQARSSVGSIIGILALLAVIAGGVYYVKFMGDAAAKVATVIAAPREIVRLYDGAATLKKSEGQTLSFGESGKVSDAVAAGTEAKAGMPLATLEAYGKVEKELADVKDREGYYEKQLAAAKAKNDDAAAKTAEAKVDEKKKMMVELEARAGKVRLVSPGTSTVAQVMVKAGDDAKAGEPAVKLTDKHVTAELALGAEAAQLKQGQPVALQAAAGGAPMAAHVSRIDNGKVTIELADDGAAKPGDSVRLVKQRVSNVIPVPTAAVVKKEGADVVYVLSDGAVHERKVTVVDRTPTEILVSSGVTAGDQVVTSGGDALHDGQKATP